MNPFEWEKIAALLRAEIGEYGELLRLFEDQQEKIIKRDSEAAAALAALIGTNATIAGQKRIERENSVRALATSLGRDSGSSLKRLIDAFPAHVAPLFEALIEEANRLLRVVRQRARQNQLLLTRLLEIHRQILPVTRNQDFAQTYSPHGRIQVSAPAMGAGYRAEG